MNTKKLLHTITAVLAVATSACDNSETPGQDPDTTGGSKYIIAGTSSEATYLLAMPRLDTGETTIVGNGIEVDNATAWLFWKDTYAYRLVYNQGNAGITTSYRLDRDGRLEERNIRHEIRDRFTTYGIYGDYIITAASGATDSKDDAGNPRYGITFTLIDAQKQTLSTKTVISENMLGNGEYCTISGIVESKGKIYTAVCPEGLSVHGVNAGGGKYVLDQSLINTEGGISGTQHPDNVWIAIYDGTDFDNPTIITDNRISYATSRFKSQYYQTIAADSEGNIYVFSASHATTQSGIQKTTLPSGVLRIKAGTGEFDKDYFVNLESPSVADRAMYKVWHITGDYFLLQMYAQKSDDKTWKANTNTLGIFKAGDKKFTWVEGLPAPENISSLSKNAYIDNGLAHIAVTPVTQGARPTVYIIDPQAAKAVPGLVITADGVGAIGKLTY